MSIRTEANGNGLRILDNQIGTERETLARRFAAAVGRDHPAIDRITPGGRRVNVWLATPADGEWAQITAPDGWTQVAAGIADTGGVCLEFAPEADA